MVYLFLINVSVVLGVLLYRVLFQRLTFFQWNRFYLLSLLVVSIVVPYGIYLDLSALQTPTITLPVIEIGNMNTRQVAEVSTENTPFLDIQWMEAVRWIYWGGVMVSFIILAMKFYYVYRRTRSSDRKNLGPFTFFNKTYLGEDSQYVTSIVAHEQIHVRQLHSLDLVIFEVFRCFNWFNPIVGWIIKELKFQHECIADSSIVKDKKQYAQLLVSHALNMKEMSLVNEFSNQSFLKKRIMMLFKDKSNKKFRLSYLAAIPLMLFVGLIASAFNISKIEKHTDSPSLRLERLRSSVIQDVALPSMFRRSNENNESIVESEDISLSSDEEILTSSPSETNEFDEAKRLLFSKQDTIRPIEDENKLFTSVQEQPEPPGGMVAFRKWIAENYDFPQEAIDAGVKGSMIAAFTVKKDGSLVDIKIVKDLGYGTGDALIELLKKSDKWKPGVQNTRKVNVQYRLPIKLDMSLMETAEQDSAKSDK